MSAHIVLLHLGMVIVGLPYSFKGQMRMDEITGGSRPRWPKTAMGRPAAESYRDRRRPVSGPARCGGHRGDRAWPSTITIAVERVTASAPAEKTVA